jgi:phospholipase/lecithinase/hemolysin
MKSLVRVAVVMLWLGPLAVPAQAAFESLYVFGDGISTTTNGSGGSLYYGKRYSNGRVWVEVLAQRQGVGYNSNRNWSYFGHFSPNLVTNINAFAAPPDASNALFIVWVNNADFVHNMSQHTPYTSNNIAAWTNAINRSLTNHHQAVQTLYAKGARTLIMPNAVDITKVPFYVALPAAEKSFVRQRIVDFNAAFAALLAQARASMPGIAIHSPDIFALLDELLVRAGDYGLTNALDDRGLTVDALTDESLTDKSLNGPGASYIFWDYMHPTARTSAVIADEVQQLLSPAHISALAIGGSNLLSVANIPIGRSGVVEGSANLADWTTEANFESVSSTQMLVVPATGPLRFYRLHFPFAWSWP